MSLWTPSGEHPVDRSKKQPEAAAEPASPTDQPTLSPEDQARVEALAEEMAEVRQQLANTPAAVVVANHAMGLYELGAIHLGSRPPKLSEAQVAIDAFAALVEAVGDRLGPDGATLRDALAQIRLAYVQIARAQAPAETAPSDDRPTGGAG